RVLKPGELLLDLYTSPDTTIVLALTTSEARAYGVPTGTSLARRLRSLRDLLASRTETTPPRAAQLALGSEIFGPAADLITRSNRVVLSAGALALFALDQLIVPGESQPLSNAREVTWTPSASALASARSAAPGRFKRTLFAVSQSQPLEGAALPAARREVAWLSQQFAGTDVVSDAAVQSAEQVARRASGYQIVHFAAHTRSGGRRPWQDALHVAAGSRDDAWLTAAQIAQLRVPAQLCVLAGCATLGNDSQWGETLDGLATAWLIAGARTVIATRWDVDDDATSELVRRFYDRLAAGDHTAAALRRAQLEMRVQPRYERPFYWAGVFLLGEPETRVVLTRRSTGVGAPRR
ncbi:MAG: CHAT domain-containing protein, partial [Candidatus Eisenbacteria bacterium]|nr:CHAT domain-containing protein [Candidatus Eisenbacteria bacterium]